MSSFDVPRTQFVQVIGTRIRTRRRTRYEYTLLGTERAGVTQDLEGSNDEAPPDPSIKQGFGLRLYVMARSVAFRPGR